MADSSVPITAGAGTSIDTRTATNGDHRQVMVPGGDGDYLGGATTYGNSRVSLDPASVFYDGFNTTTLDTADRWTTAGTAPTAGSGMAVFPATASATSVLTSKPTLTVLSSVYLTVNQVMQIEGATAGTGSPRFWGVGTPASGGVSSTALVQDGVGWEIDTTGAMSAVLYQGGVRTVVSAIPRPTDGQPHRYTMIYRQSRIWWQIDSIDSHYATVAYPNLANADLPLLFVRANTASVANAPVMNIWVTGWSDNARNHSQIADGNLPWRRAKIGANGDQVVSLSNPNAAAAGIFASINAYGGQRVSVEPTVVFFDPFDGSLDTANRWTVGGTTPTVTGGTATPNAGTVASATSRLTSIPTFTSPGLGFEILATVVQVEAAPVSNVHRFWGFASEPTTPAYQGAAAVTSTAVTDAVGFELDTAGNLYAVIYSSGTNTYRSAAISTALWRDGTPHRYAIFKRSDIVFWYVEGQDVPVASVAYKPPATQALAVKYGAYNNSTAPVAYTFNVSAVGVQDSTAQNSTVSDPTYPWRRAGVSSTGALSVSLTSAQTGAAVTGTLTATGATSAGVANTTGQVVVPVSTAGNVTFSVNAAINPYFTGTLVFEASDDNGTSWYAVTATREDGTGSESSVTLIGNTFSRMWTTAAPGFTHFRVRANPWNAGSIAVRLTPGPFLIETSPSLGASTAVIGTVRDYAAGQNRTPFTAQATSYAVSATETLVTLSPYRSATFGTTGTSLGPSGSGKTIRLQSLTLTLTGSATATATAATARVRYAAPAVAALTATSPIAEMVSVNLPAVASNRGSATAIFAPDGFEIGLQYAFGVSVVGIASGTADVVVRGYEF